MQESPLRSRVESAVQLVLMVCVLSLVGGCQHHEHMMMLQAQASVDAVHRVHMLIGEGVGLIVQGADLQLAADMNASPATDPLLRDTGTMLVERGEALLAGVAKDVESEAPKEGEANEAYAYTRDLLAAAQDFAQQAKSLRGQADSPHSHDPASHHAHLLINHAVAMAVSGSDGLMIANMGTPEALEPTVRETGSGLISRSAELVHESMMQAMGEMDDASAMPLHGFAQSASTLIAKLSEMGGEKSPMAGMHHGDHANHEGHEGHGG